MAKSRNRDDFTEKVALKIAKQAGCLCSYPTCRQPTFGATSDGGDVINIGTAAHICAAASGGPRYDENMTTEERRSASNGIWMCRDHGKAIDSNDPKFTVELLKKWKRQAEQDSWRNVLRNPNACMPIVYSDAELGARIQIAVKIDLGVFHKKSKFPQISVDLNLKIDGINETVTAKSLANGITSLDDLILIADPGMGKTTTLLQFAENVILNGTGLPIVVSLGDWATENVRILESILRRPAFRGISEDDFRNLASRPGVLLLFDGWNEMGGSDRSRARVQIENLKAELPEINIVVSTRKQVLDVPFDGSRVELIPLSHKQQIRAAQELRGDTGLKILDHSRQIEGLRDLVSIPLYLTILLSQPEDTPLPATKEEVLKNFVSAHERDTHNAEFLNTSAIQGFHQSYLEKLAILATRSGNTTIASSDARRSIAEENNFLESDGQISIKHNPNEVLSALVSHHLLVYSNDSQGFSFQHQQFQEWYASHLVEHLTVSAVNDAKALKRLMMEVLDLPFWEEAVLFSVGRLARGDQTQRDACGKAILAAYKVDPIFAAEMIYHSTQHVWQDISENILPLIKNWHSPGTVDRAFRFMLTSGRDDFFDTIWPLITDKDDQVSLEALRHCKQFRSSVLGADIREKKITVLSVEVRKVLLYEIAMNGGLDGLDLACTIAKDDPSPEVRAFVIDALAFRSAYRHVEEVLKVSCDKTFDILAQKDLIDIYDLEDASVRNGIINALKRLEIKEISTYYQLRSIVYSKNNENRRADLIKLISAPLTDAWHDADLRLVYEARNLYPGAVEDGLLARLRAGGTMFYGADSILASAGFSVEDDDLIELALADPDQQNNYQSRAAASVLGPKATGKLIDELLKLDAQLSRETNSDRVDRDIYHGLKSRILRVRSESLVAAVLERNVQEDNDRIEFFADLLSRYPRSDSEPIKSFDLDSQKSIQQLVEAWGNHMLASDTASRRQMASVATLASHVPSSSLLPLMKRLLDKNLCRYKAVREKAEASNWAPSDDTNEAQWPYTHEYKRAFLAIRSKEATALMKDYLEDEHFGELAAEVLAEQWLEKNEPKKTDRFLARVNFSNVKDKRSAYEFNPNATSEEAEAIFNVIESLIKKGLTETQKKHAVALGVIAVRLPCGQRSKTIQKLAEISSRRTRCRLLLNLILSGKPVNVMLISAGIDETIDAAKNKPWILTQSDGYELRDWLQLLPFVDCPTEALEIIRNLPEPQRNPNYLKEFVSGLAQSPSVTVEETLFKLAEDNHEFYKDQNWQSVAMNIGALSASAAHKIIELVFSGVLHPIVSKYHLICQLSALIGNHAELRILVHKLLLAESQLSNPILLLAHVIAESPDLDGVMVLITLEQKYRRALISSRTIENMVTEHVPVDNWEGAYDVVSVPAMELRRKLLSLTTDGSTSDVAARHLSQIDLIRDERGYPITEPRHPDLSSGKPWPITIGNLVNEN